MKQLKEINCTIMRGGTSKGVFFLENDIFQDREKRDQLLLSVMGSPDPKQIDGLGGATSVTSKVAIIGVSKRVDADVNYTFAQVSVDKSLVSYKGNCGNISSAVGPFAIRKGLVKLEEPITTVRIYNTNTDKVIEADVMVEDGRVKFDGDYEIAGVKGTAAPVKLKFLNPSGSVTGSLLPTGNVVDVLDVPGFGKVEVSIVDVANPLVFVKAKDLGLSGIELPRDIDANEEMLALLEKVRGVAAVKLALIEDYTKSAWETPGIPKMTFVAESDEYLTSGGQKVAGDKIDLLSRMMSMQKTHPTYAMTGAMCTAAAAAVEGSIVHQVLRSDVDTQCIRIGHPGGILEAGVNYQLEASEVIIKSTFGFRTANLLMEGVAFY